MFVSESVKNILKPKSKEEIKSVSELDVEEKEKILFNIGMSKFGGDCEGFFEFLEELLGNHIWTLIFDIIASSDSYFFDVNNSLDKRSVKRYFNADVLLDFLLSSLDEKSIDMVLNVLAPGYLSEGFEEVLKPKTQEQIDKGVGDMVKLVKENMENILQPKDINKTTEELRALSNDKKLEMIEFMWNENWEEFALDISRYMGGWEFSKMLTDLIIMKQEERI